MLFWLRQKQSIKTPCVNVYVLYIKEMKKISSLTELFDL